MRSFAASLNDAEDEEIDIIIDTDGTLFFMAISDKTVAKGTFFYAVLSEKQLAFIRDGISLVLNERSR